MDTDTKVVFEFGPFRLDPEKQLLLRDNQPIAITRKAFDTLLLLVRRNQELVSKEELLTAVWPDSFVEEANLSQTVFMLRKALGDTQKRQYIVTLQGRGYRFAAPVKTVRNREETLVAQMRSRTQIVIEQEAPEPAESIVLLPPPRRSRGRWILTSAVAAAIAILGIEGFLLLHRRGPIPLDARDSVLVADFANLTTDPVFDNTLRQGLEVQLEQSPTLSLVSEDRIQQTLRLIGQAPETPLTTQVAREVCIRTATAAMIEASIQSVGAQYVLNLTAKNCGTGDVIDREQVPVAKKEEVLGAVTHLASVFRERMGESLAARQMHDVPLAEASTASLDALKAYSLGLKVVASKGEEAAIPFFRRAVELDSNFAMAYAYLGLMYGAMGSSDLATENAQKAYELRNRASDRERFFISAYYFGRATGNQEKARQVCEEWEQTYPRDPLPHTFLSGFIEPVLASYDKAIDEARIAADLAPDAAFVYANLGEDSLYAGRLELSQEALRKGQEHGVGDEPLVLVARYDLAFLRNDRENMQAAIRAAQGKPDAMDWMADRQAFTFAYAGQLKRSRVLSREAIELAQQQGDRGRAAQFAIRSALWNAFLGNAREARQDAATALTLGRNREVEYGAAVVYGLAGDSKAAQSLADQLETAYPEDTSVRFSYLPVIRAVLALNRNDSTAAIAALEPATPYQLGSPRCAVVGFFGSLYPILIRGEAYLAARKGPEAAQEFRRILDHHTIMIGDAVSVLARYGLARSYALSGDTEKAREQFTEFLAQWKDADPDLPLLKTARTELGTIQ